MPQIDKSKRIGVLMGGLSSEREVSLKTGAGVHEALTSLGYDCIPINWTAGSSLPMLLLEAEIEVVWNALHGTYGEDGAVQGLLACMQIPGTGCGVLASALAMDKAAAKRIFESNGVPTPRWQLFDDDVAVAADALAQWPLPLVVKPSQEGSSVGVAIVHTREELVPAVQQARAHHGPVLVEQFIAGYEIHIAVLNGSVLGAVEVKPSSEFYDYDAKYQRGDTQYLVPPPLPQAMLERANKVAVDAYNALGCAAHGRVDLRITADGAPFVLEVNTLPGMTGTSLVPKIAAHAGMSYAELCEQILATAKLG